ncbi:hypothetical protein ACFYYH_29155 [Streptomyces sp. NPDC002018]|uniref:hypothetical protein n=1 Tax=Streptomyces sp. NPDC002018 TaxID=3364629 RepID=UPI0036BBC293
MGVFSRFRRTSVTASEVSTAEAEAATRTADPSAENAGGPDGAEAVTEETGAADTEPAEGDGTGAPAAEGVEIPKQQSAEAAADNEAGKNTRT